MNCPVHKNDPLVEGKSRCEKCLSAMREYQKRRRDKLKADGKCVGTVGRSKCGNQARTGKTMCLECANVFNTYQLERLKVRKEQTSVSGSAS